jgi:hypothetical protein
VAADVGDGIRYHHIIDEVKRPIRKSKAPPPRGAACPLSPAARSRSRKVSKPMESMMKNLFFL